MSGIRLETDDVPDIEENSETPQEMFKDILSPKYSTIINNKRVFSTVLRPVSPGERKSFFSHRTVQIGITPFNNMHLSPRIEN